MRERKYRAWDKINKKWYEPIFNASQGELFELVINFRGELNKRTLNSFAHESTFLHQYEITDYTGLKDKNGKELYYSDIIKCLYDRLDGEIELESFEHWRHELCLSSEDFEIIGNIYENPELLK